MYGEEAVVAVMREITTLQLPNFEGAFCKYERPEGTKGEYIAVNHLPFVYDTAIENGIVNVNVHVPKLRNNEIPSLRLFQLWKPIAEHFEASEEEGRPYGRFLDGAYFEFSTHSRPTPDGDGTYYVNLQIKVTFNNLK